MDQVDEIRKIDIACWRITSKCNRHCSFCYGPETDELETEDIFKVIDKLSQIGIRSLGITGGEPLVRDDIVEIFKKIKKEEMSCCLSTNADYYQKYKDDIKKYVEVVGLPLEGGDSSVHDKLRGEGSFDNVVQALIDLATNSNLSIHIGTVLTRQNKDELVKIERLLSRFKDRIIYWKIYGLVNYPDRKKQSIKDLNSNISKETVDSLGKFLGKEKIIFSEPSQRDRCYFLINPNGDAIIPVTENSKTSDKVLGNLLSGEVVEIVSRWQKEVIYDKYRCHHCAIRRKYGSS